MHPLPALPGEVMLFTLEIPATIGQVSRAGRNIASTAKGSWLHPAPLEDRTPPDFRGIEGAEEEGQ